MSSLGLASVTVLLFAGIELRVDARPDPCDLARNLNTSLRNLSRVEVASPTKIAVHVQANADTVILRVEDRARNVWMVRRFPMHSVACEAVSDALALIVSRLIRNLGDAAPDMPRLGLAPNRQGAPEEEPRGQNGVESASGPEDERLPGMTGRPRPTASSLVLAEAPPVDPPAAPSGMRIVRTAPSRMPPRRVSIRSPALRATRMRAQTSTGSRRLVRNVSLSADVHLVMEAPGGRLGVTGGLAVAWNARSRVGLSVSVFPQFEESIRALIEGRETNLGLSSLRATARIEQCVLLWSVGLCAGGRIGAERLSTTLVGPLGERTDPENAVSPIIGLSTALEVGRIFSVSGQITGNLVIRPSRPTIGVVGLDDAVSYRPPALGGSLSLGLVLDWGA